MVLLSRTQEKTGRHNCGTKAGIRPIPIHLCSNTPINTIDIWGECVAIDFSRRQLVLTAAIGALAPWLSACGPMEAPSPGAAPGQQKKSEFPPKKINDLALTTLKNAYGVFYAARIDGRPKAEIQKEPHSAEAYEAAKVAESRTDCLPLFGASPSTASTSVLYSYAFPRESAYPTPTASASYAGELRATGILSVFVHNLVPNFVVDIEGHRETIKAHLSTSTPEEVNAGRGFHNDYRYLAAGKTVLIDAVYDAWDRNPGDNYKLLAAVADAMDASGVLDKA